jgi:hypothetical protein
MDLVNDVLGERQEFIKKYENEVIEVSGRQMVLEKEQEGLSEVAKQNDLKLNGYQVMIESLQFEMDQVKNKNKELKQQFQ